LKWACGRPLFGDMPNEKPKGAGASEIEIKVTPAMIEAGVTILKQNHLALAAAEVEKYPEIGRTVFEAMLEIAQRHV
jgi:hypothetical protein